MHTKFNEISFSDNDISNFEDWIPDGEYNPHNVRPWLLHDHGFCVAVVFADCLQDALDIAADDNRLNGFFLTDEDLKDYKDDDITYLGNASEPFDISTLGVIELPNPKASFVAQFVEHMKQ